LPWCFGASLDHLLPIVELNKEFGDFSTTRSASAERLATLLLRFPGLVGYVLASFVVAGLAGLTQAQ
jgi:hypothetical protein